MENILYCSMGAWPFPGLSCPPRATASLLWN